MHFTILNSFTRLIWASEHQFPYIPFSHAPHLNREEAAISPPGGGMGALGEKKSAVVKTPDLCPSCSLSFVWCVNE